MHPRTFSTACSSARHHEQPPCMYTTTYHHNISAAQTLEVLHSDVKRLRETEHLLQRQIHHYRSSLEGVQTLLYAKINKANEMQNFLAPISRLPNEMLLAIFEEVVTCQDPWAEGRAEITISKVSRRWRDLAIHSPRLWRHVFITPRVAPSVLQMYKTRASRALDVKIWGWKDRRDFQRFDAALERMLDSVSRWRSLSIACVCDSHLSHLTLKLSHVGHFSGLKHFTFRALRPGQTCSVSFLTETATPPQAHATHPPPPCALKSLDAENFTLTGDLGSIHMRASQSFSRLSSLTLRRYSNDMRSFRIMIEFSAFRAMLSAIPNLTTLVLHGQPLRFRTDPVSSPQGLDDLHGGGGIGISANTGVISLPHLHTLVIHPGVLKPRYLQHTISAIHAPALRHFELVFPDSKISGQNVAERLFTDTHPLTSSFASSSSSSTYISYESASSATKEHVRRRRPRFPRVETLVLNNVSSTGTTLAFINAFPNTTHLTLGGVEVAFFSLFLRANAASIVGGGTGMGVEPVVMAEPVSIPSGSGRAPCDSTHTRPACWHRLDTLTIRQPHGGALRALLDWMQHASERGLRGIPSKLVVQAPSLDRPDIRYFAHCARAYARVELIAIQDFSSAGIF